jgi:hypothetical protein
VQEKKERQYVQVDIGAYNAAEESDRLKAGRSFMVREHNENEPPLQDSMEQEECEGEIDEDAELVHALVLQMEDAELWQRVATRVESDRKTAARFVSLGLLHLLMQTPPAKETTDCILHALMNSSAPLDEAEFRYGLRSLAWRDARPSELVITLAEENPHWLLNMLRVENDREHLCKLYPLLVGRIVLLSGDLTLLPAFSSACTSASGDALIEFSALLTRQGWSMDTLRSSLPFLNALLDTFMSRGLTADNATELFLVRASAVLFRHLHPLLQDLHDKRWFRDTSERILSSAFVGLEARTGTPEVNTDLAWVHLTVYTLHDLTNVKDINAWLFKLAYEHWSETQENGYHKSLPAPPAAAPLRVVKDVKTFVERLRETHSWLRATEWDGQEGTMKLEWFHPDVEVGYYNLLLNPHDRQKVDATYDDKSRKLRQLREDRWEAELKAEKHRQKQEAADVQRQFQEKWKDMRDVPCKSTREEQMLASFRL